MKMRQRRLGSTVVVAQHFVDAAPLNQISFDFRSARVRPVAEMSIRGRNWELKLAEYNFAGTRSLDQAHLWEVHLYECRPDKKDC